MKLRVLFALAMAAATFTLDHPGNAQGIQYSFSAQVEAAVDSVLAQLSPGNDHSPFFLVLYKGSDTYNLSIHEHTGTESIKHYLRQTNRYTEIKGSKIKILLDSDLNYGVWYNEAGSPIRTHILDGAGSVRFDGFGRLQ